MARMIRDEYLRQQNPISGTHRTPLGKGGWALWRDAGLASAGFPASRITAICDEDLPAAADLIAPGSGAATDGYAAAYATARQRLSAAVRTTAMESQFREAIAWQGPEPLAKHLAYATAGKLRGRRGRALEQEIARYLQQFCLSTRTLGFFGPVGWARIDQDSVCLDVTPGSGQLSRRTTYFDSRTIETLAIMISMRPEVLPELAPRVAPSAVLDGLELRLPFSAPITLSASEARVFAQCDGAHGIRELAGDPPDLALVALLMRLCELGAVQMGLHVPISAWPERELEDGIQNIRDPDVRRHVLEPVAELVAARDALGASTGDADRVSQATRALAEVFARVTESPATRRGRNGHPGHPLVYEDTVRDVQVHVGRELTDMLAPPLSLLLDSAAWLVNAVAAKYLAMFRQLVSEAGAGNGNGRVPLLQAAVAAMPEVFLRAGREPAPVAAVVAEFQERWRRLLSIPPGVRRHHVASGQIEEQVARQFATGPAPWSGARVHSVDIMIAAASEAAVASGDCQFVLHKLHPATNSLESRVFVAQHPDPARLLAAAEADHLDRRVYAIPKRNSPLVTSRLYPPTALLSSRYTYLCLGSEAVVPPAGARVLPAVDLLVEQHGGDLVVVHRGIRGLGYDLIEVIGEMLSALVTEAFRPVATGDHRPRVSIDKLVVARESWTFTATATRWAFVKDQRELYAAARQWRAAHRLPERVFARVLTDATPIAVDFRSLALVGLLADTVRRAAEHSAGRFTLTEMLPDVDQLWLRDAAGNRYTSELKLVAVNGNLALSSAVQQQRR